MDFLTLFPDLQPWMKSIGAGWPASLIKSTGWLFPVIETVHLLGLAALGGCVLILNLRLMGVGIASESAALVEKNMRPWLWVAILVLIFTGLLMGTVVAQRLYTRPVFLVKMLSLVAALILSIGVTGSIARNEGVVSRPAKIMAGIALAIWLFALSVFATTTGPAPGTFHIVCAAWLIVMGFGSKMTRIMLGSITAVVVITIGIITYVVFNPLDNYDIVMEINRWTVRLGGLVVAGFVLWEFAGPKSEPRITPTLARLIGVFTILVWVTVAASGRWIGLGGGQG